ncbi:PHP-associated domain-containing protein [Halococcus agarilyticus]|uniref:PHP-associated domain-containing protein n=1 Tax=Halococcus agarilyticus TaxID=1232219 RepID=UPI000677ECC8|nr:PHP-associated domain-containing protein [Halococcus agarilyticus]
MSESRIDAHVKVLDERVVRRAKRYGLDAVVYAPHFTRLPEIRAKARAFSDDDFLVVPGRELFTGSWRNRQHVLAFGLTDPVPDFLALDATMAELDRQAAAVLIPHPEFLNVGLGRAAIRRHEATIDAVETDNAKFWPHHARRARGIATEFDLLGFGSSYAHLPGSVGEVWTAFDAPIETEADLVAAFTEGAPRAVRRRHGALHWTKRGAEFAHLGYENSWGKFDRLVLPGETPTHPGHALYGGRFDESSVY